MASTDASRLTLAYAARDVSGHLSPFTFSRREVGPTDVEMKVTHCGMCHSDLHQVKNEWGNSKYPMVPGHEVVGVVTKVGEKVSKFSVGDKVGVGCMVRSCWDCDACKKDSQQYCSHVVWSYNDIDIDGSATFGGYASHLISEDRFVLKIPDSLPLETAAPLLCAGITVYSPMIHFGLNQPGASLGVVGLGGLGHMAVKFGKAFGLRVVVLSTSISKKEEAISVLKADDFVITKDPEALKAAVGTLDYIIDTVSAPHPVDSLLDLLKTEGKYVVVGAPPEPTKISTLKLIFKRIALAGSLIGGVKETQDMLEFCAEKNILPLVENIPISEVNTALDRMFKADVKYRFVINVEESLKA